jgi:PAS domain S-box-containing protein
VLIMAYSLTSQVLEAAIIKRQLEKSEGKYRKILESIQEGYYEVDLSGRFTFFNDALCRTLGYRPDELMGMNNRQYMSIQNAEKVYLTLKEIYQTGKPANVYDWEFIKKDGERKYVEASLSLMRDADDRPVGFRGITRDVTERKKLEIELQKSLLNVESTRTATILGFARLAEYRDKDTGAHLERIRSYARLLTEKLAEHTRYRDYITEEYVKDLYLSCILHDIGKVGIPDAILHKPDKLTREEFEVIKEHSVIGGEALRAADLQVKSKSFLTLGKEICYYHHERWDGSGYPSGLKGEQIPLSARIVALADVYDALTSERSYKIAFAHDKARQIIVNEKGRHFDPDVVDAFIACEKEFESICCQLHYKIST